MEKTEIWYEWNSAKFLSGKCCEAKVMFVGRPALSSKLSDLGSKP